MGARGGDVSLSIPAPKNQRNYIMGSPPKNGPNIPPEAVIEALQKSPNAVLLSETSGDPNKPLTPQQSLFVAEYCKDFNASRAARAAKYSENCAPVTGSRLLKRANVLRAISETQKAIVAAAGESPERNIRDLRQIIDSPETDARDRVKAIELLGRFHGMWTGANEANQPKISINLNYGGSQSINLGVDPSADEVIDVPETGDSDGSEGE